MQAESDSTPTFDEVIEQCIIALETNRKQDALEKMKARFPLWVDDIKEFYRNLTSIERSVQRSRSNATTIKNEGQSNDCQ